MIDSLLVPLRGVLDRIRVRPSVRQRLGYWALGPEFRQWCQTHSCEAVEGRYDLYRVLMEREGLDGPIDYIEFGVSEGLSMRWWVENNHHPGATFVGFDTFEGLPEAWAGWPVGAFTAGGEAPAIDDPRCRFVKGLFQETVPAWVVGRDFSRRTVLHLDADLYTSTLLALTQLLPKLKPGSILIFDDFCMLLHEYRAFCDATTAYRREFVPLCRSEGWANVGLKAL